MPMVKKLVCLSHESLYSEVLYFWVRTGARRCTKKLVGQCVGLYILPEAWKDFLNLALAFRGLQMLYSNKTKAFFLQILRFSMDPGANVIKLFTDVSYAFSQ
jgi:hypothetical protein